MSFTPGPWRAKVFSDHRGGVWHSESSAAVFVTNAIDEADAHLIAAAPELYEAAGALLDYVPPCDDPAANPHVEVWCITHQEKRCLGNEVRGRAIAALAKARGER